jgi:hypothetical protein
MNTTHLEPRLNKGKEPFKTYSDTVVLSPRLQTPFFRPSIFLNFKVLTSGKQGESEIWGACEEITSNYD